MPRSASTCSTGRPSRGTWLTLDETYSPGAKLTLRLPVAHAPQEEPLVVG